MMNKIQVEEIVKAILARKYSWACVLMLRFHGYDPSDYLPYRTYIRLLKENYQSESQVRNNPETVEFNSTRQMQPQMNRNRHKAEPISMSK